MVIRGHIEGGRIVPDDATVLPEGAAVRIEVLNGEALTKPTGETLRAFAGCAHGLARDASAQHDHYLYGTPKR